MRRNEAPGTRRRPLPVLLYHSVNDQPPAHQELFTVSPAAFAQHMTVLADSGFSTVPLATVADQLRTGSSLPPRTAAITFDDGYADLIDKAWPVLVQHGMDATLFQTTGCIGGTYADAPMLTAAQLRELSAAGLHVGSHTVTHPHLDLVPPATLRAELVDSRDRLEQVLGRPVDSLAYPHGSFRRDVVRQAAAAGYTWAAGVKNAYSHDGDDVWAIARLTITSRHSAADLAALLAGDAAPLAWRRERLRTTVYRHVRRLRTTEGYDHAGR